MASCWHCVPVFRHIDHECKVYTYNVNVPEALCKKYYTRGERLRSLCMAMGGCISVKGPGKV